MSRALFDDTDWSASRMLKFKYDEKTNSYDVYDGDTRVGVYISTSPTTGTDFELYTKDDMDQEYDAGVAEGKAE